MRERANGEGSIVWEKSRERWLVRLRGPDGKRRNLGRFVDRATAESVLNEALRLISTGKLTTIGGSTLRSYGEGWMACRKNKRSWKINEQRWSMHVASSDMIDMPLFAITRRHVKEWLKKLEKKKTAYKWGGKGRNGKPLSSGTRRHCLNLLRCCMTSAKDDEEITINPCDDIKVITEASPIEPWEYLEPDEQKQLLDAIPAPTKYLVAFAIYTGLRQGEMWNLRLCDVHSNDEQPHVTVRYGSRDGATKSGKIRRVYLLDRAKAALDRWLAALPLWCGNNHLELAFPTKRGERRQRSKLPKEFIASRKLLSKRVRWHDLRHTCASSLVAGWWGSRWSLPEVRDMLGHSTVVVTERYAHLAESAMSQAAKRTNGVDFEDVLGPNDWVPPADKNSKNLGGRNRFRTCDIRLVRASRNPEPTDGCETQGPNRDPGEIAASVLMALRDQEAVDAWPLFELASTSLDVPVMRAALELLEASDTPLMPRRLVQLANVVIERLAIGPVRLVAGAGVY